MLERLPDLRDRTEDGVGVGDQRVQSAKRSKVGLQCLRQRLRCKRVGAPAHDRRAGNRSVRVEVGERAVEGVFRVIHAGLRLQRVFRVLVPELHQRGHRTGDCGIRIVYARQRSRDRCVGVIHPRKRPGNSRVRVRIRSWTQTLLLRVGGLVAVCSHPEAILWAFCGLGRDLMKIQGLTPPGTSRSPTRPGHNSRPACRTCPAGTPWPWPHRR